MRKWLKGSRNKLIGLEPPIDFERLDPHLVLFELATQLHEFYESMRR